MTFLIDTYMPDPDRAEVHSTRVASSPATAMESARAVSTAEVPIAVALMALRSLPAILARRRPPAPRVPALEAFQRMGFVVLEDTPSELVVGGIGRFWRPSGDIRRVTAADFESFSEPGYAKTVFNFRVEPDGHGSRLITETRIDGTDDGARRRFRRYWRLIHPGSALIRHAWLRAIRKRAEA